VRAAAKIVCLTNRYESRLFLRKDGRQADGSSILSILALGCPKGTEVEVQITGQDSKPFMAELVDLFEGGFGENKPVPPL